MKSDYLTLYDNFLVDYQKNIADPLLASELLAKLTQLYTSYNMAMVAASRKMSLVARDIEMRVDDNGKQISSAKAVILVDATDEMFEYKTARAHVQNIEQLINSIKTIARLITNEYSVMGNI